MSFLETAKTIIKGYFEQYPAELEKLKNAESEKIFQSYIYTMENSIKNSLNNNKYEFSDLLTLFLRGEDATLNSEFSQWFNTVCPDSDEVLEYINNPETLLYFLVCDNIDTITIKEVLFDGFGVEPPKPPKPSDNDFTFNYDGKTYTRVNKRKAETLILQGKTVVCTPSNLRPFGVWGAGALINKETLNAQYNYKCLELDKDVLHYYFNQFCAEFSFYNCNNEVGRYISFYAEL